MKKLVSTAFLVVAFAVPALAQPQGSFDDRPEEFWRALELQIESSLRENTTGVAAQQLKNVIGLSTLYRHRINLDMSVPTIVKLHRESTDAEFRNLCIAALQSLNTAAARSYLKKRVSAQEMQDGRETLMAVLNTYLLGEPLASR